jgi:hypothetical protein
MSRSSRGDSDSSNKTRHALRNRYGLNVGKNAALPEDEGLGSRERRGLARENGPSAFGQARAPAAIKERVKGDLMGRKDNR